MSATAAAADGLGGILRAPSLGPEDVGALTDTIRRLTPAPVADASAGSDAGWARFSKAGLAGLAVDEAHGGAGLGLPEVAAVARELGRLVSAGPFLGSSVLGAAALAGYQAIPSAAAALATIAAGRSVSVATQFGGGEHPRVDGEGRLHGTVDIVIDAPGTESIAVFAVGAGGLRLSLVAASEPEVTVEDLTSTDLRRRLGRVRLDGARAAILESDPRVSAARLAAVEAIGCVALAADCVGGAEAILERTVEYANQRVQFGRVIGSFQAIKHQCADLLVELEFARSALQLAVARCTDDGAEFRLAASVAKAVATEAYVRIATDCIQLHGGIGYTWEHPAHLYYRRAWSNALLLGTSLDHRRRVAAALLD